MSLPSTPEASRPVHLGPYGPFWQVAQSKPMCEILARLNAGGEFDIVTFGDQVILEAPVESWPLCDVMLSWHSEGFPLKKAQAYVELRRPFLINDVHMQDVLLDRRRVYKTLMDNNVPVPRHILVNREAPPAPPPPEEDELTTSSSSAEHSPRAVSPAPASASAAPASPSAALSRVAPAASPVRAATQRPAVVGDQVGKRLSRTGSRDGLQPTQGSLQLAGQSSRTSSTSCIYRRSSTTGPTIVLPDPPGFVEGEDYVELNGVRIDKPFVEKPISGEDHNIYIYYPHSMGGGVKRLFRKVDNKSADYDPHHPGIVRRDGSYIYEEFLTTGGTDVKVYTVGPRYAHAEARKSPVVDGKVNRTPDGKEVRFPVLLSPQEKEISRMVCFSFGQRVCGFDLLRSETGRSYVCDVNGWSFVKNSKKYYDDAAGILRSIILSQLAPHRLSKAPAGPLIPLADLLEEVAVGSLGDGAHYGTGGSFDDDEPVSPDHDRQSRSGMVGVHGGAVGDPDAAAMRDSTSLQDLTSLDGATVYDDDGTDDSSSAGTADSHRWLELRCVLAVIRHGDRTPKQKMKVTVTQAPLLELFDKYKDSKGKQAKLKEPGQLQELLDITRQLLADMETRNTTGGDRRPSTGGTEEEKQQELHEEQREKLRIVRTVLEQGGTFSGINRKVQLKPTKWSRRSQQSAADPQRQQQQMPGALTPSSQQQQQQDSKPPTTSFSAGKRSSSTGGGKGPKDSEQDDLVVTELLLILKFGGVLTHAGRAQAEDLGKMFRMVMYPRYGPAGGGLLRLHSTYRHDMKIYSSDEGRVQMSAAAFIKGMLDLEGSSLTPILVSLVTKNASMLDAFGKGASDDILNAKNTLYKHLTWDPDKALSLCSRLALPLSTPANTSPPLSPKRHTTEDVTAADGAASPFIHANARKPHTSQLDFAPASASSASSSSTAATLARLPTTTSCLDLLHQGIAAAAASGGSSIKADSSPSPPQQLKDTSSHGSSSLAATATVNAAHAALAAAAAAAAESKSSEMLSGGGSSSSGSLLRAGSSAAGWAFRAAEARAAALSGIRTMPERPLALLYQMVTLMKVLVDELREKCLREERQDLTGSSTSSSNYSSLTTAPDDWRLDEARPCSGERLLLMFDRWRKLLKSFYNEKKQQFDISKVPDIYDSAKYDAIHNSHLDLTPLKDLYRISRQLASVVVPHEYGLDGPGKLIIGSKICAELLGKLICDLDSMKEESIITAAIEAETAAARAAAAGERAMTAASNKSGRQRSNSHSATLDSSHYDLFDTEFGQMSLEDQRMQPAKPIRPQSWSSQAAASRAAVGNSGSSIPSTPVAQQQYGAAGVDPCATAAAIEGRLEQQRAAGSGHQWSGGQDLQQQQQQDGDEPEQEEKETLHRLCPTYASDINSPLRHVRTRIYFTSESHIHSLINVLRYCHLPHPHSSSSGSIAVSPTPSGLFGQFSQPSSNPGLARPHTAAAAAGGGAAPTAATAAPASKGPTVMLSAATPSGPVAAVATTSATGEAIAAAAAASSKGPALAVTRSSGAGSSTSVFASASSAAAAAAGSGADGGPAAAASSSTPQPLVNAEGQALLEETDEFDYLTHIVFAMYENKQAPVDSPDRFFVEIQFSNGANYDPTTVTPLHDNHVLPTKPRRPLTNAPGVTLQMLQELLGKYAKGKSTASNYQLQVALRAPNPLSVPSSHATSKLPTPGVSRQPSGPLPPAAVAALMAAGPGTVTSAPLPADIAVAAAAEVAAEGAAASVERVVAAAEAAIAATAAVQWQ